MWTSLDVPILLCVALYYVFFICMSSSRIVPVIDLLASMRF